MHREKVAKNSDATRDVREEKKGKVQRADNSSSHWRFLGAANALPSVVQKGQ